MVGMLTEQRQNKLGKKMCRRSNEKVGAKPLLIRYRRTTKTTLPRRLQSCETVLFPMGCPQNRPWQLLVFEYFLSAVLEKLERIYFPDRGVCVALVAPKLSDREWQAFVRTFWFAGNCIICTEDLQKEEWADRLMDDYGLTAISTSNYALLKQADVLLTFKDPNPWIRQCKQNAVVLNLSETPMCIHYGRIVIDGVEVKPLPEWLEKLPLDADWTAFCGCFLSELSDRLHLKHPLYAKGINKG
ncbi:MAG: hypothetical protein J6D04_04130 [Clostridia bacterium]|nr:hypothetical protein [Clostridia bacterium]